MLLMLFLCRFKSPASTPESTCRLCVHRPLPLQNLVLPCGEGRVQGLDTKQQGCTYSHSHIHLFHFTSITDGWKESRSCFFFPWTIFSEDEFYWNQSHRLVVVSLRQPVELQITSMSVQKCHHLNDPHWTRANAELNNVIMRAHITGRLLYKGIDVLFTSWPTWVNMKTIAAVITLAAQSFLLISQMAVQWFGVW